MQATLIVGPSVEADLAFLRRSEPPEPVPGQSPVGIVDLFAGLGGLTIGALEAFRRMGYPAEVALAVDHDPAPLRVLQESLQLDAGRVRAADLEAVLAPLAEPTRLEEEELFRDSNGVELLLAGPPCQGHSTLNNHTRHDDPRNDLYLAVARAARLLEPAVVIVENVRGVGNDRRAAVGRCSAALEELRYEVTGKRIDLHETGVPQRRVRHVLVATRERTFAWNLRGVAGHTVGWAIGDLMGAEGSTRLDTPSKMTSENERRINWLFDRDVYNLPNAERPRCHQSNHSYVSMYGRLHWDRPAQTITSGFGSMGQGRFVHPRRRRTLTAHEAARLQFLPDFIALEGVEKRSAVSQMIGNAAPPALTIALVQELIEQGFL